MILQGSRLPQQTSERMRRSRFRDRCDQSLLPRGGSPRKLPRKQTPSSPPLKSCTAGKLAALLGGSARADCLQGRFVTYTKANKTKSLGVSAGLLRAVWREVAIAMAAGALVDLPHLGVGEESPVSAAPPASTSGQDNP